MAAGSAWTPPARSTSGRRVIDSERTPEREGAQGHLRYVGATFWEPRCSYCRCSGRSTGGPEVGCRGTQGVPNSGFPGGAAAAGFRRRPGWPGNSRASTPPGSPRQRRGSFGARPDRPPSRHAFRNVSGRVNWQKMLESSISQMTGVTSSLALRVLNALGEKVPDLNPSLHAMTPFRQAG